MSHCGVGHADALYGRVEESERLLSPPPIVAALEDDYAAHPERRSRLLQVAIDAPRERIATYRLPAA